MKKFNPTYSVMRERFLFEEPGKDIVMSSGNTLAEAGRKANAALREFRGVYILVDKYTWRQFLQIKAHEFLNIPREAKSWAGSRMSGGPMNKIEYAQYVEDIGEADGVNRLKSRTLVGWYVSEFLRWTISWNKSSYEQVASDQACDYLIDLRAY